jgi:diketogulonate reductase-like aldo/keto reductase
MNPLWQQKKLREFCEKKGVHITAFSPLGAKGTPWGTSWVMDSQELKDIAIAKGKTTAQVIHNYLFIIIIIIKKYCDYLFIYFLYIYCEDLYKMGI